MSSPRAGMDSNDRTFARRPHSLGRGEKKRVHGKRKGFLSCQPANGDPDSVEVAIIFLLQFLSAQLNVGATYLRRSIVAARLRRRGLASPPVCQRKASGPDNDNTILSVASRLQSVREYLQQSISTIISTIIVPGGRAGAAVTLVTVYASPVRFKSYLRGQRELREHQQKHKNLEN